MAEGDPPSSSDKRSDFIAGALHRPTRGPTITELRCCLVAFACLGERPLGQRPSTCSGQERPRLRSRG